MFGKNPTLKQEHNNDGLLRVVSGSPFLTMQGEGPYAGHPAIFIRLHGCHLKCWFCDTEFSDPADKYQYVDTIASKTIYMAENNPGFFASHKKLIVITGGEPMRQNILPLCKLLWSEGYTVQIETAGSFYIEGLEYYAQFVISPKTQMVNKHLAQFALAYKYVVNSRTGCDNGVPRADTQFDKDPRALAAPPKGVPVYVSPMDEYDEKKNRLNLEAARSLSEKYGYILSTQLHKLVGVA